MHSKLQMQYNRKLSHLWKQAIVGMSRAHQIVKCCYRSSKYNTMLHTAIQWNRYKINHIWNLTPYPHTPQKGDIGQNFALQLYCTIYWGDQNRYFALASLNGSHGFCTETKSNVYTLPGGIEKDGVSLATIGQFSVPHGHGKLQHLLNTIYPLSTEYSIILFFNLGVLCEIK